MRGEIRFAVGLFFIWIGFYFIFILRRGIKMFLKMFYDYVVRSYFMVGIDVYLN